MPGRRTVKLKKNSPVLRDVLVGLVNLVSRIKVTYILILLLIIAAFLLGVLVTKVSYLEGNSLGAAVNGTSNTTAQTGSGAAPKPLHVAKAIGIDANKFKSCLESGKYTEQVATDLTLGQSAGVDGTPATFINGQMISGAQPYSVFKEAIDRELAAPGTAVPSVTPAAVDLTQTSVPALGNADAPVTIVEFADYQCPFCEQWFKQIEANLIKDYVKTGKVRFIFQNYAFLGPDSNTAVEGAYCANEQGKFWAYHDFMYNNQGQEQSGWASKANLL